MQHKKMQGFPSQTESPAFLCLCLKGNSGVFTKEEGKILLNGADARDAELLHQQLCHIGAQESRQRGTQVDVLHAQIQQRQQYDHRLLLVPGDVVNDGQFFATMSSDELKKVATIKKFLFVATILIIFQPVSYSLTCIIRECEL